MDKKELEIVLSKLKKIKNPKVNLEQYQTPSYIASDILFNAYLRGDIRDKVVGDFGCGNGIFGIGAGLLRANEVIFVDKDENALEIAKENSKPFDFKKKFLNLDMRELEVSVDTSFSNPPFGIQTDEFYSFIDKQIKISKVSYILVPAGRKIKGKIVGEYIFKIPRIFFFHEKRYYLFKVQCFRVER